MASFTPMSGAWVGKAGKTGGWPGNSLSPYNLSIWLPWAFSQHSDLNMGRLFTWELPSPRVSTLKDQAGSFMASSYLAAGVMRHYFCCMLLVTGLTEI